MAQPLAAHAEDGPNPQGNFGDAEGIFLPVDPSEIDPYANSICRRITRDALPRDEIAQRIRANAPAPAHYPADLEDLEIRLTDCGEIAILEVEEYRIPQGSLRLDGEVFVLVYRRGDPVRILYRQLVR